MIRFLSWVAVFAVIYAVVRIILLEGETPDDKRDEVAAVERGKKVEPPKELPRDPFGAIPYAKRSRVFLFTRQDAEEESRKPIADLMLSEHWQFLARHQIIFQEVAVPRDIAKASPRLRSLVENYRILSVPTLVVMSPDGRELGRSSEVGGNPKTFVNWIRDLADIRFRPFTIAKAGEPMETTR